MQITVPGQAVFDLGSPFSALLAPGRVFFLNDAATYAANDTASAAQNPTTPARTIAAVLAFCVANNGDVIVVGPSHSESLVTLLAATAVDSTVIIHTGCGIKWTMRGLGSASATLQSQTLGIRTARTAPKTLPATTNQTLFTITGGPVKVYLLYGIVTTVVQTQADNAKFQAVATGLTAVDLCAVGNITAAAVGTLLSMTGTFVDALVISANQVAVAQAASFIAGPGVLRLNTAATNTGAVQYYCVWEPAAPGACLFAS